MFREMDAIEPERRCEVAFLLQGFVEAVTKRLNTQAQLYQSLIGREAVSAPSRGAGQPPLSQHILTFIGRLLRKGCPGVVRLVERAVRPAWCPGGRLPGDGVIFKCCFQTQTQLILQRTVSVVLWCVSITLP